MALNATIDLTVKKPDFKSMKSEIRELTVAAQQAVMQFGEFSPEAVKAEHALAGARDRMEDFNDRVKAVNPDNFSKINTVVQGVASGFAAAQGAMALFGNESKDFEKTMIKLQGAMALAQGLEGLGKVEQQFKAIFTSVVDGAKKAFAAIKAGIGSTGIGLLVVALGAIVAYWDEISAALFKVNKEEERHLKLTNDLNAAIGEQIKANQVRKTDLLSLNAIVQNSANSEETRNGALRQLKALLPNLKTEELGRAGALQRINDEVKLGIKLIDLQIRAEGVKAVAVAKATEIAQNIAIIRAKQIENDRIVEYNSTRNILDKIGGDYQLRKDIEALKKTNNSLTQEYTGLTSDLNVALAAVIEQENQLGLKQEEKKEVVVEVAKTQKDFAKEEADRLAKIEAERVRLLDERVSAELSANEAQRQSELAMITDEGERIQKQFSNKIAALQEAYIQEQIAAVGNAEALALIDKKYEDLRIVAIAETEAAELALNQKNIDKQLAIDADGADKKKVIDDKSTADQLTNDAAIKQSKEDLYKASIDLANAVIGLVGQQTAAGKVLALGTIAADTAMSISNAMTTTTSPSPDNVATGGIAGIAKYIALAAMILNNAKRARDILKGGQPSAPSGGGQMSGGGMPQMSAPNISSSLPSVSGFDTKVFVTEGDIRRTTDRVDSTRKVSVVK